jgi:hypothetical protein
MFVMAGYRKLTHLEGTRLIAGGLLHPACSPCWSVCSSCAAGWRWRSAQGTLAALAWVYSR